MTRKNWDPERPHCVRILATQILQQDVALVPPGSASSALPRGLRISLDPALKRFIEGVKVGSQLLASVNRYETIQSLQGEHVPREIVVSESVEVFKRLKEPLAPVFISFEVEGDRHHPEKPGKRLINPVWGAIDGLRHLHEELHQTLGRS